MHLCTKLRNRLLSKTSYLLLGNEAISTLILNSLISTTSKLHHGLVRSDIEPRDKQNFLSCQKICTEDIHRILEMSSGEIPGTRGMCVYLQVMQSIIVAYYEKNTSLTDRTHFAWLSVFICRFWSAWLDTRSKDDLKKQYTQ